MLLATKLLCVFCFLTSPDGVPYIEVTGSYRSIWQPTGEAIRYGFAAGLQRISGNGFTVAGQFNAHSMSGVHSQAWGVAAEAVAQRGSRSTLVGVESLVANYEPTNLSPKIGVNIVYKSDSPVNTNSIGLWFTSDRGTGFESAIKLDRYSVYGRAAILDLSDMDEEQLKNIDLIKLPKGKAIRWNGQSLTIH